MIQLDDTSGWTGANDTYELHTCMIMVSPESLKSNRTSIFPSSWTRACSFHVMHYLPALEQQAEISFFSRSRKEQEIAHIIGKDSCRTGLITDPRGIRR